MLTGFLMSIGGAVDRPVLGESDACNRKRSSTCDPRASAGPYGDGAIGLTIELYSLESGWLNVLFYTEQGTKAWDLVLDTF